MLKLLTDTLEFIAKEYFEVIMLHDPDGDDFPNAAANLKRVEAVLTKAKGELS